MELNKYKNNNKKMIFIIFTLSVFLISMATYLFYQSYAYYNETKNFDVINGTVEDPGDIYFSYYVDDQISRNMPSINSGYVLDVEKSFCSNNVQFSWDNFQWLFQVDYKTYNFSNNSHTKCSLYFKKSQLANVLISSLMEHANLNSNDTYVVPDKENKNCTYTLAYDGSSDNNLRYVGANPCNYVKIDEEYWRIIGVMNNILDSDGNKSTKLKLVKDESIGQYSWDTSDASINSGYGINEWSEADLMKLLNPGYEDISIGGSLYYNSNTGTCYNGKSNATISCDFTNIGLKENMKKLLSSVAWATASNDGKTYLEFNIITSKFYELERSRNVGKICTSGIYCTDSVNRTSIWQGKVGLLYPSDYGYATSGGENTNRLNCLEHNLYDWSIDSLSDCKNNNWLYHDSETVSFLTPNARVNVAPNIYFLRANGKVDIDNAYSNNQIFPVVFVNENTKIISGDGSKDTPYLLG